MSEFSIIDDYFKPLGFGFNDLLGIGDDGAVIECPTDHQLVVVTDTLVEGVHFPVNTSAFDVGWKSLAVNLSDLAAMGATPAFYSLALSLPQHLQSPEWLSDFSNGLKALSTHYHLPLIGGDTTKSKVLSITITAQGWVPRGQALLRSGAQIGDEIMVSGVIGDGGLALKSILDASDSPLAEASVLAKLNRPDPRVALGTALRDVATACIDISDGLLADLGHVLKTSGVGAELNYEALPLSASLKNYLSQTGDIWLPWMAGDDYELCFTLPKDKIPLLMKLDLGVKLTSIGQITKLGGNALTWLNLPANVSPSAITGYQHF